MKILVTVPALGSVYGGPSRSVRGLAQALGKVGASVDLVTTNANGQDKLEVPLCQWQPQENYRLQYFPSQAIGNLIWSNALCRWLFQHVKDYDLVQTNAIFSVANLPVYWACWQHQVPYITVPRGMLEPWALSYRAWKKRLYYTLLEEPALQRANAIQMLATPEAEQIKPLNLRSPIVISPNGVYYQDFEQLPNAELFYQQYPETRNKTLILFLGRVDPKKGLDLLARVFGSIRPQFPQLHLVIAGPDSFGFMETVRHDLREANCLDAVTFTGSLTGALKYAALNAANLYVAPSYSEGFSMSVLEGMAAGLPCVITTGCNFPEAAIAEAAHVVEINTKAIAEAITHCLLHPSQAQDMGCRARQFILENYTWDKIAERLIQEYRRLVVIHSA
jgi:glycosyltransferase involved in cell wall biosynthesis